jgi:hypothetical protein
MRWIRWSGSACPAGRSRSLRTRETPLRPVHSRDPRRPARRPDWTCRSTRDAGSTFTSPVGSAEGR